MGDWLLVYFGDVANFCFYRVNASFAYHYCVEVEAQNDSGWEDRMGINLDEQVIMCW